MGLIIKGPPFKGTTLLFTVFKSSFSRSRSRYFMAMPSRWRREISLVFFSATFGHQFPNENGIKHQEKQAEKEEAMVPTCFFHGGAFFFVETVQLLKGNFSQKQKKRGSDSFDSSLNAYLMTERMKNEGGKEAINKVNEWCKLVYGYMSMITCAATTQSISHRCVWWKWTYIYIYVYVCSYICT